LVAVWFTPDGAIVLSEQPLCNCRMFIAVAADIHHSLLHNNKSGGCGMFEEAAAVLNTA